MKILITGSAGFLGKNLYKRLKKQHKIVGIDKNESEFTDYLTNLTDEKKIKDFIKTIRPDIIIHTAALTNVDYCEIHREEAYNSNVETTKNLIDSLENQKTKFIFISSDYVYDGIKGNFNEESQVNPLNYYGETKLEAEQIVKKYKNYLILRSTVIFGWDEGGKNFFMQLFNNQKNSKQMKAPIDQYGNPTYINLFIDIISKSILKNLTGTFIATGPENINRYDFGLKICDIFDFNKKLILPIETKSLGQVAPRPLNCGTDSGKIRKVLQMDFPSLKESLINLKSSIYAKR
jgi:dTDP-4-dehydrorhamnose reductase